MDVVSRKSARASGLKRYFTGKPCKRGHIDQRWVSSLVCVTCRREKPISRDYFRAHYEKHKERKKRQSSEWYHANAKHAGQRNKAYAAKRLAEQPEHVRAIGQRRDAKRRATKIRAFVDVVDRRVVFHRDNGVCGLCGKRVDVSSKWEIDHIIPLSKGGAHAYANAQLAHQRCNRSKHAKVPKGQRNLFQVVAS